MVDNTANAIREHIQFIGDLARKVDVSDLAQLAKIHEHFQQVETLCKTLPQQLSDMLAPLCRKLIQVDEDIILENCPDPHSELNTLCRFAGNLLELRLESDISSDVKLVQGLLSELSGTAKSRQTPCTDSTSDEVETPSQSRDGAPSAETMNEPDLQNAEYVQEPLYVAEQELEYLQSFMTECQEHVENIETFLLSLEQTPDDLDKLNELFRPFHTIKGMAGFLNLKDINALTHAAESLLDLARKGKLKFTSETIDVVFQAVDVLKVQVAAIGNYLGNANGQAIPHPPIQELLHRLRCAARGKAVAASVLPRFGGGGRPLGEILVEEKQTTPEVIEYALQQQAVENKPLGEILKSMGAVSSRDINNALRKQKTSQEVIRVDMSKLDRLVNLSGELVIAQSQVTQDQSVRTNQKLAVLAEQVSKITREVQDIAMSLRMVPIAQTFQKMGRVARDIAHKSGKKISFVFDGEETELDKNVIQEIADPLMHMVRNSVDHGIESLEIRRQFGKPETGTVKLRAYHQGGNIVIEVSDDGSGIDKERVIKKGIERGLVAPEAQLSDQQIYQLIMAPGFSTAEKITDISGRGVGLDVVKRNIDKLRGKVEIHSVKDQGTTFLIRLPLTLAVIDGMIVRSGNRRFIIPTLSIIQAVLPDPEQLSTVQGKGRMLNLRGELHTLICLGELFGIPDATTDPTKGMVVIVQAEDRTLGIVLDELLGQQQVVIKSLGEQFGKLKGISGGAILGDGTVGLIIDPAALLKR